MLPDTIRLPPTVVLPLTLNTPVIYSPVVANTATFDVPPTPTVILQPELTTVTLLVPLLMLEPPPAAIPVSKLPLPIK